jgi:hypothetical protein
VINRQVVDLCDMAVGIFWTRLGTPTDVAESGTAEEIKRVGAAGKPVMLYFSKARVDPDLIDLEEYKRLRDFKQKANPSGLVEHYESLAEFRKKFTRQLAMKVLEIVARDAETKSDGNAGALARLSVDLLKPPQWPREPQAAFGYSGDPVEPYRGVEVEEQVTKVSTDRLTCSDPHGIPDFGEEALGRDLPELRIGFKRQFNREFFREVVEYCCQPPVLGPFRLAVTAAQEHGLRDIYIEIRVSGLRGELLLEEPAARPIPEPYTLTPDPSASPRDGYIDMGDKYHTVINGDVVGNVYTYSVSISNARLTLDRNKDSGWLLKMELSAVQAGRTVHSENSFWIVPQRTCAPSFDATIYSSDATPFASHVELEIEVQESNAPYRRIVDEFIADHPLPR